MSGSHRTLFVYGTLRPGGRYWPNIAPYIEQYDPAMLEGWDLWHLDEGYPTITEGSGSVFGDVLYIHTGREDALFAIADAIEQCSQDNTSLYLRRPVQVTRLRAPQTGKIPADAYVFNPAHGPYLRQHGSEVPGGEWSPPDVAS